MNTKFSYLPPEPYQSITAPTGRPTLVTKAAVTDYADSYVGNGLTPERLTQVFRLADAGYPAHMFDAYESIVLIDAHLRGQFEQRMDEVAAQASTIRPGANDPASIEAADLLRDGSADMDWPGLVEHLMLAVFYGASYAEVGWQTVGRYQFPVEVALVPHRRFVYDPQGRARITSEQNASGELLERLPGSSWVKAESRRFRKQTQAGLLRTAAYCAVFKRMSIRDWLVFIEKFGIPMIVGKYGDDTSKKTRDTLLAAMRQLGTEGLALLQQDDVIEVLNAAVRGGGSGSETLHGAMVGLMNAEMSKLITGGTLTAEMTGTGGSFAAANVHQTRGEKLTLADARRVALATGRDIGREFCRRNKLTCAAPYLHVHIKRDSLLMDAQIAKILGADLGLELSAKQMRETFSQNEPIDAGDTVKAPTKTAPAPTDAGSKKATKNEPKTR